MAPNGTMANKATKTMASDLHALFIPMVDHRTQKCPGIPKHEGQERNDLSASTTHHSEQLHQAITPSQADLESWVERGTYEFCYGFCQVSMVKAHKSVMEVGPGNVQCYTTSGEGRASLPQTGYSRLSDSGWQRQGYKV
jgi:hypothetical protein